MKRKILAGLILAALLLGGCSAQRGGSEAVLTENSAGQTEAAAPVVDEKSGKIRLTLAGIRMDDTGWRALADGFNAQSEQYVVELRDYSAGAADMPAAPDQLRQELADAETRLNTELTAGNHPDMLAFDWLSPLPYIGKELLLDLDPYAQAGGVLNKESVLCWDALHEYGGLYLMAQRFYVDTLSCTQEFYEAHRGWTIADYLEIEKALPEGRQMIYTMSPELFLTQMGGRYLSRALDLAHASCDFDNEDFIGILDAALRAGEYALSEETETSTAKQMESGRLMCCADWLDGPEKIAIDRNDGGARLAYIGWPTTDGSCGSTANLRGVIGALAQSPCPEGCWEFIQYTVTHGTDAVYSGFGSPVYLPLVYEAAAEWNADPLLIPELQISQDDLDAYLNAVNAAPVMGFVDESVMEIIQMECAPMLQGESTPEETAARIQSRVSLYMAEQYD